MPAMVNDFTSSFKGGGEIPLTTPTDMSCRVAREHPNRSRLINILFLKIMLYAIYFLTHDPKIQAKKTKTLAFKTYFYF